MQKMYMAGLAIVLLVAACAPALAQQGPFADVPTDHWAYNAIQTLADAGLIEGYPDGTFKGQKPLTRYEFAVAIARMLDYVQKNVGEGKQGPKGDTGPAGPQGPAGPAGTGQLTAEQQALLDQLKNEFMPELRQLRADVDDLTRRVEALEAVPPLELPKLKVGGDIRTRAGWYGDGLQVNSANVTGYPGGVIPVAVGTDTLLIPIADGLKDSFKANDFWTQRVRVMFDGQMNPNLAVHVTLLAEPWNNFTDLGPIQSNTFGDIVSPGSLYARGMMDSVNIDEAYADISTSVLTDITWRVGKQYWGWGQGLLVDNDQWAMKSVLANMDFGSVKFSALAGALDREAFDGQTTGVVLDPADVAAGLTTHGQDDYLAGRLAFDLFNVAVGGNWLQNGFGAEQGWSVDASAKLFGHKLFAEYAQLTKNVVGDDVTDFAPKQNEALIAGLEVLNTSSFGIDAKWGYVQPNYAFNAGGYQGVFNAPFSLLHPYAEWSADYINWVDRPLFLDPTNVAKGWEFGFTYKKLFGGTMPISVRWYGGDAYNPDYLSWLANGSVGAAPDKWRTADSAWTVSVTKSLAENVDLTVLYGQRGADRVLSAAPADDVRVLRGELLVRF